MNTSLQEYPLIIVDDEPLARQAVAGILQARFPSFPILGEADSGPSGVALFKKLRPCIVLMDIRIPGFDGLEASRSILKETPETQIIVLSAFDDFKFVQQALHDGVLGYLLKPVRPESLKELLEKAVERISSLESRESEKKDIRLFRSLAVREQVSTFIYGSKGGIPASDFAELSHPPIRYGYFLVFRSDGGYKLNSEDIRKVNKSLDRLSGCLPGNWMGKYLPVFIRTDNNDSESWKSEAEFLSREITHIIRNITGSRVSSGVGPVAIGPENFGDSFRIAFDSLQDDGVSRNTNYSGRYSDTYPVEKESVFLQACRASDGTAAFKAAENLIDDLISPDASLMDARFAVTEFLIVFRREWESLSGTPKRRVMANLLREALLCNEYDVLREWFLLVVRDLIRNMIDTGSSAGGGREELILRKVKHYIDLNKLREVSLEASAESVGITPSYLSRVFKEKTGQHFHDYVLDRRLASAAGLLKETNLSSGEIAYQVGYGDVAYFSRIFRKRYGSSPRDYRRNR